MEARKRELRNLVRLQESYLLSMYARCERGELTPQQAKATALEELRHFRYGNNDYLWVADYDSRLISHPDPALHGADFSDVRDVHGNLIVPPMVKKALADGEGYTTYWWRRLDEQMPAQKLSYASNFAPWQWVLSTGVYVDDVQAEVERRKERAILDLRELLHDMTIARSGYVFVFDSNMHMVVHPSPELEGSFVGHLKNPVTGSSLPRELAMAWQERKGSLTYRWDRPDDPGNHVYEKIAWVDYFGPFDWYIAASVYTDELDAGAAALRTRMLLVSLAVFLLLTALAALLVRRVLDPVRRLSATAARVREGDLSARCEVRGSDETALMAAAFNEMIDRLREQVQTLDSRVRERTAELERANTELLRLDEMKSTFLSSVSHELRTPLTSILGFAEMIQMKLDAVLLPLLREKAGQDPKVNRAAHKVRRNIAIIASESQRLTNLINDVLDLSKMEAGRVEWRMATLDVGELLERCAQATGSLFARRPYALEVDVPEDLPPVRGDRDRLLQVAINLVSNAVKFTPDGSVALRARREGDAIRVSVLDTGVGIAPGDLDSVFEKFRQVGDTLTDKPVGTGLGLPICREIVEHHGGRIWAESEPGQGSTFHFLLPVAQAALGLEAAAERGAAAATSGNGRLVLVAEDEPVTREMLRELLEDAGYSVAEASDGLEALESVRARRPDAIVMDVRMPHMDGLDAARALKGNPAWAGVPILGLSTLDDPGAGRAAGIDAYLTKPVDAATLRRALERLLARRDKEEQGSAEAG
jgi:signal transduction histidine kinase/CheY-like chemotaxis protein